MHIGVSAQGFVEWGGGIGFIENLLFGLAAAPDKVTKITVFVPKQLGSLRNLAAKIKRATFEPSKARQHLFSGKQNLEPWKTASALFSKICPEIILYDGTKPDLSRLCQRLRVDVLLPISDPFKRSAVPWAGYLPDCQHLHYPQFFNAREIVSRDRYFSHMLRAANVVMVNSRSASTDLNLFFPNKSANVFALPFAPLLRFENISSVFSQTPLVKKKYETGENYLIISNQFWIHKNHETAFKAFALEIKNKTLLNYNLVCTGMQEDYRFPGYFFKLQELIASLNIKDRIIFTGYIDKLDQLALLNGAAMLLQPTLFEGGPGGGAAYDSVALGIPSILSNIPVNLEINDPTVSFFNAGDPQSLADAINLQIQRKTSRRSMNELTQTSNDYARKLGLSLFDIAKETLHKSH